MIIKMYSAKGKNLSDYMSKAGEVIDGTIAKLLEEKEEIKTARASVVKMETTISNPEGIESEQEDVVEVTLMVQLFVNDSAEGQFLTVEHYKDQPEYFQWNVDMDADDLSNNEEKSNYDAWTVAKNSGEELAFETVESVYDGADLSEQSLEVFGDMKRATLNHKDGFKVVQIYQNGNLIQELKLTEKDNKTEEDN